MCWSRQVHSGLADEFRLVALDLRGHGMSEQPLDPQQYRDAGLWAADVRPSSTNAIWIDRIVGLVLRRVHHLRLHPRVRAGRDPRINFAGAAVTLNDGLTTSDPHSWPMPLTDQTQTCRPGSPPYDASGTA